MKKLILIAAGLLPLVSLAWLQLAPNNLPPLASLLPAGPMIYLQAGDFHSLLGDWNSSGVKKTWLGSANYQVFANSNLLQKLDGLYQEYGEVAGFLPGLPGTLEIAGRESAFGLYDLREQHFVYISRVEESQLVKSQLWRLREKFTTREASGITFFVRRDSAAKRTVAFAFTNGWLVIATRDDLLANTLALIARQAASSLEQEPWFSGALAQAGNPGELRMALNLHSLLADVHFRSYWIQRNISDLRPWQAGLADLQRSGNEITENRIFVRDADQPATPPSESAIDAAAALRALGPDGATLVKTWAGPSPEFVESMIEAKLLQPSGQSANREIVAPQAASTDETAGSEQDLETRIDEVALPSQVLGGLYSAALKKLIDQAAPDALLHIQTSVPAGRFIRTPSVLVVSRTGTWVQAEVRDALVAAVESLWSTSRLGVRFEALTLGRHSVEHLDGLAQLLFAVDGNHLFLGNDAALLQSALDRIGTAPLPRGPAYTAEFRHRAERSNYFQLMRALDFGAMPQAFVDVPQGPATPRFFSENVNSLSEAFPFDTITVTRSETASIEKQRVVYH